MIDFEATPTQQIVRDVCAPVASNPPGQNTTRAPKHCTCGTCGQSGDGAQPNLHRRRALSGLFAGLLLTQMRPARASDDLLDPGQIGAARKSVAAEGLLDPARLGGSKTGQTTATPTPHRRRSNRQPPSYARNMADSVVSSLDDLTRAAAKLVDEVIKLDARADELASKLRTLQEEMERKLGEYRSGLFCSGCDKTKSEILARGEEFPHPGQTIIRPTQAQIDAKERALQIPIDHAARELRENRARRAQAVNERDEALLQIGFGLSLWRTSITLETALIWLDEEESAAANKVEYDKAENQIGKLRRESYVLKSPREKEVAREIKMWTEIQEKLDRQRRADRRDSQNALMRAAAKVGDEQSTLQGYIGRDRLSQVLTAAVQTGPIGVGAGFNDLGGLYRMGNYSLADHDEVLPSVNSFITTFRRSRQHEVEPAEATPMQQIKGKLRDLLKCDPAVDKLCDPPSKNVGTGVKG